MAVTESKSLKFDFAETREPREGLSVADLNRYIPAIREETDIRMTGDALEEGLFLVDGVAGMKRLPEDALDLIIARPPEHPWHKVREQGKPLTLQEYYTWNEGWIAESKRILKRTGSLYVICSWRYSGMYHALLSQHLKIQTRITWRKPWKRSANKSGKEEPCGWEERAEDIWFAGKTADVVFRTDWVQSREDAGASLTNVWGDVVDLRPGESGRYEGDRPEPLIRRILETSSYKLGWVLDPFMRSGGVGVIAKKKGRRFIGFEPDQDRLIMAMKRIDQT